MFEKEVKTKKKLISENIMNLFNYYVVFSILNPMRIYMVIL
jgi:hypothetical protein